MLHALPSRLLHLQVEKEGGVFWLRCYCLETWLFYKVSFEFQVNATILMSWKYGKWYSCPA